MMSESHQEGVSRADATSSADVGPDRSTTPDPGFGLAAAIVETLCGLPTIPTKSWCDSAAAALGGLFDRSASVVVACTAFPDGSVRRIHGLGVAVRAPDPAPNEAAPCSLDSGLRCGLEGLVHLGWATGRLSEEGSEVRSVPSLLDGTAAEPSTPEADTGTDLRSNVSLAADASRPAVSRAPCPVPPQGWQPASPISALCATGATRVVAGIASIGPPELGRRLAVYVADLGPATTATPPHSDVLAACLPLLARKAARALERTWLDRGSWLSEREKLVLEHLIIGRSVPEIATELGRSHHTVHDNVKSLHRKLSASTRGELIARALGLAGRTPLTETNPGTQPDMSAGAA